MSKITDTVTDIARPVVERHGCELWDIEYVKEAGGWCLRVYIDRAGGVSISHCEEISRALDPLLDEHDDLFPGPYTFEVSSAGAERPLKRPGDFERFIGSLVEVKLYSSKNGRKEYAGTLLSYDGGVTIGSGKTELRFEKNEIANVRLRIG